jgi:hypothetical protein
MEREHSYHVLLSFQSQLRIFGKQDNIFKLLKLIHNFIQQRIKNRMTIIMMMIIIVVWYNFLFTQLYFSRLQLQVNLTSSSSLSSQYVLGFNDFF